MCLDREVTQGILSPWELNIVRSTPYTVHRMLALAPPMPSRYKRRSTREIAVICQMETSWM